MLFCFNQSRTEGTKPLRFMDFQVPSFFYHERMVRQSYFGDRNPLLNCNAAWDVFLKTD